MKQGFSAGYRFVYSTTIDLCWRQGRPEQALETAEAGFDSLSHHRQRATPLFIIRPTSYPVHIW